MKNLIPILFVLLFTNSFGQEKALQQSNKTIDSCQLEIDLAQRDRKQKQYYIDDKNPLLKKIDDLSFSLYFNDYIKTNFNISVLHSGIKIEQHGECYSQEMTKIITKKFGVDYLEKTKIIAKEKYKIAIQTKIDTGFVFNYSDSFPKFPQGQDSLYSFLSKNLTFPASCMNGSIRGKVYCKLTFEKDGSISSIDIVKSPHNCYSQEALRVIKLMQNWIPAKLNNQPVKFSLILPINFE